MCVCVFFFFFTMMNPEHQSDKNVNSRPTDFTSSVAILVLQQDLCGGAQLLVEYPCHIKSEVQVLGVCRFLVQN